MAAFTTVGLAGATEFEFTLHFTLPDTDVSLEQHLDRLFDAGCDDALVGIGAFGQVALAFTRSARTAREAVLTALGDVHRALPGARLLEATPDLVGLTEVADLMAFSRQNMRKILVTQGKTAPEPVHQGRPGLWHLHHMLTWLASGGYQVDPRLADLAEVTMQANLAVQNAHADAALQRELAEVLA